MTSSSSPVAVSKGKLDHVPDWLAAAGIQQLFHRVAQKPGKPLWVGRDDDTMVFALPGNPVSSLVGAVAYVGPFLRHNLGIDRPNAYAQLSEPVTFPPQLTLFQRVSVANQRGRLLAKPVSNSGSGDLISLLHTTGLLVLPPKCDSFSAGETFPYLPLSLL